MGARQEQEKLFQCLADKLINWTNASDAGGAGDAGNGDPPGYSIGNVFVSTPPPCEKKK